MNQPWIIAGQGLAGTCLAWELWKRGVPFLLVDPESGGSSRVAAGLVNPVTGKNFQPSANLTDFLPHATAFYSDLESTLGTKFWHPMPILRLAADESEWSKMQRKSTHPDVIPWLAGHGPAPHPPGWAGALEIRGGGRLDTRSFLNSSREFFQQRHIYQNRRLDPTGSGPRIVWCEGAAGLLTGRLGPHRCAKGEILTLHAPDWDPAHIRIGAGGWLVPIGEGNFKAGSTYEWDQLDESPTAGGLEHVSEIARRLGGGDFDILAHEAGIRPILRRSEPLIGPLPDGSWMFNGLGSKGSLYAPGIAARLAAWLNLGTEPEPEFDFRFFRPVGSKRGPHTASGGL